MATPFGWMLAELNRDELHGKDYKKLVASHHLAFPGLVLTGAGVALVLLWVLLGQIGWMSRGLDSTGWKQGLFTACKLGGYSLLGLGVALLLLLVGLPRLAGWLDTGGLRTLAGAAVGAGGVLASVGRILKKPGATFAPYLGGVAFAFFAALVAGGWAARAARLELSWAPVPASGPPVGVPVARRDRRAGRAAGAGQPGAVVARGVLPRQAEDRLRHVPDQDRRAQGLRERHQHHPDPLAGAVAALLPGDGTPQQLSTPLTVCGAATVSSRSVKTHYGIPALSVSFDPGYVTVHVPSSDKGEWGVHQAPTEVVNAMGAAGHKRLTTMLAVAISSAAVSPAMGRIKIGPTSMLLAFANVRLGVWMPNPRYANAYNGLHEEDGQTMAELSRTERKKHQIGYPHTGLGHLFKEFLGIHDLSDPYLYMTDGGHWDNTGLVEMLRRRDIREIVCIDADCGSLGATSSLGKVLDLAPLECGVSIQLNLDTLRAHGDDAGPGYAERTVTVGFFRQGPTWGSDVGVIWYAKPGLSRDMSTALLGFRESHPDFPVISTADQFFDSSTYVAYRELGRHNGRRIRKARAELVAFLRGLDLPAGDVSDSTRRRVLTTLDQDLTEQPWVAQELVHALHFMRTGDRVAFLVSIERVLAATTEAPASSTAAPAVDG